MYPQSQYLLYVHGNGLLLDATTVPKDLPHLLHLHDSGHQALSFLGHPSIELHQVYALVILEVHYISIL